MSAVLAARKRTHSVISEDDDNRQTSPRPPIQSCGTTYSIPIGLDWKWVKALDQSSVDDLPAPFHAPDTLSYTGEDNDQPILRIDGDLGEYTHWALARIRRMVVSKILANMLDDPSISVKWTLSLHTRPQDTRDKRGPGYKGLSLDVARVANHEATYTQMCGIVLPREQSCTNCKAGNSKFRHCVVLPRYLNGSCGNCWYNYNGNRCSHRPCMYQELAATKKPGRWFLTLDRCR